MVVVVVWRMAVVLMAWRELQSLHAVMPSSRPIEAGVAADGEGLVRQWREEGGGTR